MPNATFQPQSQQKAGHIRGLKSGTMMANHPVIEVLFPLGGVVALGGYRLIPMKVTRMVLPQFDMWAKFQPGDPSSPWI